jgi:DNA repair protein SbcC/Rad50
MRLRSLELNNFRAFPIGQPRIDLDHDAVLFYGRNGVGKTAIFDAIELTLTGGLRRLSAVRDLSTVLINARQEVKGASTQLVIDGSNGVKEGHIKIGRDGFDLEPLLDAEQTTIFQHTVYLQQSEIRRLISASSASLGDIVRSLALSGEIEKLDRALAGATLTRSHRAYTSAVSALKERQAFVEDLRARIAADERALNEIEGVDATAFRITNELNSIKQALNISQGGEFIDAASIREGINSIDAILQPRLAQAVEKRAAATARVKQGGEIVQEKRRVELSQANLLRSSQMEKLRADLAAAASLIGECEQELKKPEYEAIEKQQQTQLLNLLEAVKTFGAQDVCPICDRPLANLTAHINDKIARISEHRSAIQARHTNLKARLNEAREKQSKARQEFEKVAGGSAQLETWSTSLQKTLWAFLAVYNSESLSLEDAVSLEDSERQKAEREIDRLSALAGRLASLRSQIDAVSIRSNRITENLQKSRKELEQLLLSLAAAEKAKNELEEFVNTAQEVRKRTSDGIERVLSSFAMGSTRENFEDLFNRLARSPLFGVTISDARVKNRRPEIQWCATYNDKRYPGDAIFSQGELNSCAMAFFLALATTNPQSLGFLLLDDPVQNMDEIHIEEFGNILKFVKDQLGWQVIVALHDESIYQYLKRQLYPSKGKQSLVGYCLEMGNAGTQIIQDVKTSFDSKVFLTADVA